MAQVSIVVGSVYGTASFVGEELQAALEEAGHGVTRSESAGIEAITAEGLEVLIAVTSSTGAGDLPENIAPFFAALLNQWPRIDHLGFAVVGLGDTTFGDTFNGAAKTLDRQLAEMGARRLAGPLLLDACETVNPERDALPWVLDLLNAAG